MAKDRYEISLWDDVFVAASGNVPGHYEEEKIAIIGSDSMTTQCRAIEPKLVCNVNGKVTFTFKMYYRYHDELTGEDYDNPFLKLLVNERKVKVLWLGEWYDLIIKNIQESSNGKTVVYTCEDANINELAKTGFNLIFDDDLSYNNVEGGNQGTVEDLVRRTIAGTDWVLGTSDTIQQFTEEAVYEVIVPASREEAISAYDMVASNTVSIGPGKTFLVYYPQLADIINEGTQGTVTLDQLYLAYDPIQQYDRLAKTEMLVQANCCTLGANPSNPASCNLVINGSTATFSTDHGAFGTIDVNNISSRYRANRLVREQVTKIEPVTGKYCYVYKYRNSDDLFYKTIETEFKDATYATNLFVNGSSFTAKADGVSPAGWDFPSTSLSLAIYPTPDVNQQGNSKVYVSVMGASDSQDRYFYNDALKANSYYFLDGVKKGEKYIFRIKAKEDIDDESYINPIRLEPFIGEYTVNEINGNKNPVNPGSGGYFDVSNVAYDSAGWATYILTCETSFTASEIISKKIGLFIKQPKYNTPYTRFIEAVEFFKYIEADDAQHTMIEPGELSKVGIIKNLYTYFDITNKKKVNYLYSDTEDWDSIPGEPVYDNTYSKIRSINIKQSNRFNILQTIAETFECWIRFNVPHDINTGQLIYKDAEDHPCATPRKFVNILKEIGEERSIGFVYGIDLQSIQRTIESNSIVTKTIVLENNNEFGKNGTCRISRSSFNYPRTDYIYNFDYYINHELLNGEELTKDLYYNSGDETTTQGFYKNLHDWNLEYEELAQKYSDYSLALLKNQGLQTVYESTLNTSKEDVDQAKKKVCNYLGTSAYTNQSTQNKINEIMGPDGPLEKRKILQPLLETIEANTQIKAKYSALLKELQGDPEATPPTKGSIKEYEELIENCEDQMLELEAKIGAKTELFEKKYARFISEGSWTDSKYYDDNLYYLDANSVAYTSSRPKVSYNISVIRVTGLKDFWMKDFALGDISYIEDTEFFGYTYIQEGDRQVKTPYREKVIITEITYNFDEPNKDTFKVQNYRTQFEDLFQRIAAQTQSLQYSTGIYNKVSDIIKTDSTIKSDVLKASFDANSNVLDRTSVNNMVTTDDAGITVTNIQNASEAVRVTSGGLFITTDGGDSWQNAIRGDGIGTQYLTSGAIDTKKIQIFGETGTDESAVAFKWDADGINAYDTATIPSAEVAYDPDRFVRFNKDGITIQTKNDNTPYTKLKLGRINNQTNEYGLLINDSAEQSAFYASDDGDLYIKGNISAKSLVIGPSEKPILEVIDGEVSTAVTSITDGFPYTNLLRNSDTFDGWTITSHADIIVNSEANQIKFHWAAADTSNWVACVASDTESGILPENNEFLIPYSAIKGKKVTFSAYVASDTSDTSKQPNNTAGNRMRIWVGLKKKGNTSTVKYRMHRLLDSATDPALSTEWTRWEITETIDDNYFTTGTGEIVSNAEYYVVFAFYCQTPWNYLICKPQIEINDHASDWHPSSNDQGFKVQSSSIKQTASEISAAVSSISSLDGRVSSNESWINLRSDKIDMAVQKTTTGGNLLRNSNSFEDWTKTNSTIGISVNDEGRVYARFTAVDSLSWRSIRSKTEGVNAEQDILLIPYKDLKGKQITFSCDVQSNDAEQSPALYYGLEVYRKGSADRVANRQIRISATDITTAHKTISYTIDTFGDDFFLEDQGSLNVLTDYIGFCFWNHSLYRCVFSRPQIEIGTLTTWTPIVGDNGVSAAYAGITVNANQIALKVSESDLTGPITSTSIVLNPTHININGVTSINSSFVVDTDGYMHAKNGGDIAGWTLSSTQLSKRTATTGGYRAGLNAPASASGGNRAFFICDETGSSNTYPFSVKYDGSLVATKADITGTISATAGTIGGLTIEGKFLHNGASAASATAVDSTALVLSGGQEFSRNINGTERGHLRFALGSGFGVSTGGRLYASNAVISGDITATSLTLTGGAKVAAADVSGQLTAAYIDGSHINASSISAGKINGEGLVITGTGQFGSFVIGYDGQYSSINAGDTKISSYRVITPVVKPTTTLDLSECQIYNGSIYQYAKWKSFSTLASTDLVLVGSNNP